MTIIPDDPSLPVLPTSDLGWLGQGASGVVHSLNEHTVVKTAIVCNNEHYSNDCLETILIERAAYQHLGPHPRICRYIGPVQRGIVLERFGDPLRHRLLGLHDQGLTVPDIQALKWSIQFAEGLAYLHQNGFGHGDIGCQNILLKDGEIKLFDFRHSAILGMPITSRYECRSQRWGGISEGWCSVQNELFALGSAMYEIWMSAKPYEDEPEETVKDNYKRQCFPDVSNLLAGTIIENCWHGIYQSANEVVTALQSLPTEPMTPQETPEVNYQSDETDESSTMEPLTDHTLRSQPRIGSDEGFCPSSG